jgi:hypothetical protein
MKQVGVRSFVAIEIQRESVAEIGRHGIAGRAFFEQAEPNQWPEHCQVRGVDEDDSFRKYPEIIRPDEGQNGWSPCVDVR